MYTLGKRTLTFSLLKAPQLCFTGSLDIKFKKISLISPWNCSIELKSKSEMGQNVYVQYWSYPEVVT